MLAFMQYSRRLRRITTPDIKNNTAMPNKKIHEINTGDIYVHQVLLDMIALEQNMNTCTLAVVSTGAEGFTAAA